MWGFILDNLPRFLEGAWVTVQLAACSCVLGLFLAIPVASARLSKRWSLSALATGYVFFFRGTPLLAQIFLIYYGSGQFRDALEAVGLWALFREPWFCAVLALALNTGAYTSEILRGAIQSIPKGEIEAASALGLKKIKRFRLIVMPRAIRISWPAYTNEIVYQIQATSLVSIITVMDITGVARATGSRDFTFYESFGLAAILYLILIYGIIQLAALIEQKLNAHLGSPGPKKRRGIMEAMTR